MSMKNSNDTIGNQTRDLPACSAGPQFCATAYLASIGHASLLLLLFLNLISFGHRHHAYVSNHMKTKTDQHATYNTLKSVPALP
jgi:hypothetical protein